MAFQFPPLHFMVQVDPETASSPSPTMTSVIASCGTSSRCDGSKPECSTKVVTTSHSKHQSAPDQHGHEVEHITRRVPGGIQPRNARESGRSDVEVAVPLTVNDCFVWISVPLVTPALVAQS